MYDHARTFWTGETLRSVQSAQLTERGPAPFRLDDRPGLLKVLMVVGNKAYRREFIEREGFTFPPATTRTPPGRTRF